MTTSPQTLPEMWERWDLDGAPSSPSAVVERALQVSRRELPPRERVALYAMAEAELWETAASRSDNLRDQVTWRELASEYRRIAHTIRTASLFSPNHL